MLTSTFISQLDLVLCLSKALDFISHAVVNHHFQVAYISHMLSKDLNLSQEEQSSIAMAGALHDIGAISLKSRMEALKFEIENPEHMELGYRLLSACSLFSDLAEVVRYHHLWWEDGKRLFYNDNPVPFGSHIVHLADRVAVSLNKEEEVFSQVSEIQTRIKRNTPRMFSPKIVEAFMDLSKKEFFWLDVVSTDLEDLLSKSVQSSLIKIESNEILDIAKLFSLIIDFRSRFTSTHSSGVASTSENLSFLLGFSERECLLMRIAGYLHDLGKLSIPAEILEKPSSLTPEEFNIVRKHTYYTYRILEKIPELKWINQWASFHHERLNGNGYPFHLKPEDISLKSRIMAVSDVFTALTEDRPYRKSMGEKEAMDLLKKMVSSNVLDNYVVSLLDQNFEWINRCRKEAQREAEEEYRRFNSFITSHLPEQTIAVAPKTKPLRFSQEPAQLLIEPKETHLPSP